VDFSQHEGSEGRFVRLVQSHELDMRPESTQSGLQDFHEPFVHTAGILDHVLADQSELPSCPSGHGSGLTPRQEKSYQQRRQKILHGQKTRRDSL
jgi:hypothetical protein